MTTTRRKRRRDKKLGRRLEQVLSRILAGGGAAVVSTVSADVRHLQAKGLVSVHSQHDTLPVGFRVTLAPDAVRRFPPKWRTILALAPLPGLDPGA